MPPIVRSAAGILVVFVATEALAVTAQTGTVKGRPPVAGQLQVINTSAPGLNPAQGDALEIAYQFHDPDGLQESTSETLFRWLADERVISGANQRLFTPGPAQNKRYLTVEVLPVEIEPSDPDRKRLLSAQTRTRRCCPREQIWRLRFIMLRQRCAGGMRICTVRITACVYPTRAICRICL